jgi:hypothetical protein
LSAVETCLVWNDTRVDRGDTTGGDDASVVVIVVVTTIVCWWGEWNSLAETWSLCGGNGGKPAIEALVTGLWGIDGANHSIVAVWVSGAEEPNWTVGLGDFEGVNANCASGSVVWDEGGCEPWLVSRGVELLCAWVGKRRLRYGVVATAELELDTVTDLSCDLIRAERKGRGASFISSDDHSDVDREGGDDQRSNAGEGSGELHFSREFKKYGKNAKKKEKRALKTS